MLKATCVDECCRQVLLFLEKEPFVTCYACGQTHNQESFLVKIPFDPESDPYNCMMRTPTSELNVHERAADQVKVGGFSHYHHKLISPLLTTFGVDKQFKVRPLKQLTGRELRDCGAFGDRTFRIEARHLNIKGYGKDSSSFKYLEETLKVLLPYNNDIENLVPLHADGDGHCLVHATSRAIVGGELLWHPLRVGLKQHFIANLEEYKNLLGSFISDFEWRTIIKECDPEYRPRDGSMIGLGNVHIFGLSNLLRRPIILLDSMAGMKASADYAALFLPGLNPPDMCSNKAGILNPPICLAWSSEARHHFVPLIPIRELPLPRFPKNFLPEVWGLPQAYLDTYLKFDEEECVIIGGEHEISHRYVTRLTHAIDDVFAIKNGIKPNIVADLFHYEYSRKLVVKPKINIIVEAASACLRQRRLLRCIACLAIAILSISFQWLGPSGHLYKQAKKLSGGCMRENFKYQFKAYDLTCVYDSAKDTLVIDSYTTSDPCSFCKEPNRLRLVKRDGSTEFRDGDRTNIPLDDNEKHGCPCGFKHWWDGTVHDTRPITIPIVLDWNGNVKKGEIEWFQHENNQELNSNLREVAILQLMKHFPDELDNDELKDLITAQIMDQTKDVINFEADDKDQDCRKEPASDVQVLPGCSLDHPVCSTGSDLNVAGSNEAPHSTDDLCHSPKEDEKEENEVGAGLDDESDAPSSETQRLNGYSSPEPSTSRLSPATPDH